MISDDTNGKNKNAFLKNTHCTYFSGVKRKKKSQLNKLYHNPSIVNNDDNNNV